jgi:fluoride ion exporter CrcB/FEX
VESVSWVLLVGVGGVLGAVARHLVETTVVDEVRDTLAVNVLGSWL